MKALKLHELLTLLMVLAVPGGIIWYLAQKKPSSASNTQPSSYVESQNALSVAMQNELPPVANGGSNSGSSVASGSTLSSILSTSSAMNQSFVKQIESFLNSSGSSGVSTSSALTNVSNLFPALRGRGHSVPISASGGSTGGIIGANVNGVTIL